MNRTNAEGQSLLIKNGQIFDGVSDRLRAGHVLISERTIAAIDASPIAESDSMTVIDGAGRVLMPGMTDAHVHLVGMANTLMDLPMASQSQLAAATLASSQPGHKVKGTKSDRVHTQRAGHCAAKHRTSEHPGEVNRTGHLTQRGRHGQPGAVFFTGAPRCRVILLSNCTTPSPAREASA
jgi:hypothetical protein